MKTKREKLVQSLEEAFVRTHAAEIAEAERGGFPGFTRIGVMLRGPGFSSKVEDAFHTVFGDRLCKRGVTTTQSFYRDPLDRVAFWMRVAELAYPARKKRGEPSAKQFPAK